MHDRRLASLFHPTTSLLAIASLASATCVMAQEAPRSYVASPDIYKVVAEGEKYRVIEVTWKPGQRDQFHSHPALGVYYVTDCKLRGHRPDGKSGEGERKAGSARVQNPVKSHSVENFGTADCRLILFEEK